MRIRSAPNNGGFEIGDLTLQVGQTQTMCAALYDSAGNYLRDHTVTWIPLGKSTTAPSQDVGQVAPIGGTCTTYTARNSGFGVVHADDINGHHDNTGIITVFGGGQISFTSNVKIRSAPNNGGFEIQDLALSIGQTQMMCAAFYDVVGNYLGDRSMAWVPVGKAQDDPAQDVGTVQPFGGACTTFTARRPGVAVVVAQDSIGHVGRTGRISVAAVAMEEQPSQASLVTLLDVPLLGAADVPSFPLPPQPVPAVGPFGTGPIDQPVGTLQGAHSGAFYCITATPEGSAPLFQCMDLGPSITPLLPPFGPVELVEVPATEVGPTEEVEEGSLGSTQAQHVPATSLDVLLTYEWFNDRLKPRLEGVVSTWEPVDLLMPSEVGWWIDHGDETALNLRVVVKGDGAPLQTVDAKVPMVGQALAALAKNGGL